MNLVAFWILSARFSVKSEMLENHVMGIDSCNENSRMQGFATDMIADASDLLQIM